MKTITIIGCGWLGQQVAQEFISKGQVVYGSYRSEVGRRSLEAIAVKPFLFEASIDGDNLPTEVVKQTDIAIIAIPPFDKLTPEVYGLSLQRIARQFADDTLVIFTSSTGVYPQKDGIFDEEYDFEQAEKLNPLFLAERGLRDVLGERLTILRLGGLIGPNRHPIKFLAGKTIQSNGTCPISLIHSSDIIRVIQETIERNSWGEVFNVVYPSSLDKRSYYSSIASKLALAPPQYKGEHDVIREIASGKLSKALKFKYKFDITNWF